MTTAQLIIMALIQYGPQLALVIAEALHRKDQPTIQEWRTLLGSIKPYEHYVQPLQPPPTPP